MNKEKVILYGLGFLLVLSFLLALNISYNNGFNTGLKAICKDDKVLYDSLKGYKCDFENKGYNYVDLGGFP